MPDHTLSGERLLARLESEERSLSAQRRRLQDRIDLLPGAGAGAGAAAAEELAALREQERVLSDRRRQVHERIESLRAHRDADVDDAA
jgi:hypothetical protein